MCCISFFQSRPYAHCLYFYQRPLGPMTGNVQCFISGRFRRIQSVKRARTIMVGYNGIYPAFHRAVCFVNDRSANYHRLHQNLHFEAFFFW
jgi:hypothetical protein